MDDQMPNSPDQIRVNHLRKRLAEITVQYEDVVAGLVVQGNLLVRERETLVSANQVLENLISEQAAEIERLKQPYEEPSNDD
jgi:hypothetical protein